MCNGNPKLPILFHSVLLRFTCYGYGKKSTQPYQISLRAPYLNTAKVQPNLT